MNLLIKILLLAGASVTAIVCNVVLASQSGLVIPAGIHKGLAIDKQKLETAIASQVKSVSKVYDLSIGEYTESNWLSGIFGGNDSLFTVSFTVETNRGEFYEDVGCTVRTFEGGWRQGGIVRSTSYMVLRYCESSAVKFDDRLLEIEIGWSGILIQ